jgi:hypothetical protein
LQRADRQARESTTIQHLPACSVGMIRDDGCNGTAAQCDPAPSPCPRLDDTDRLNSSSATVQPHGISRAMEAKAATGLVVPAAASPRRPIPSG